MEEEEKEAEEARAFKTELKKLLNKYDYDTKLDIPDFNIASFIYTMLKDMISLHDANVAWHEDRELTRPNPKHLSVRDYKQEIK